MRVFSKKKFVFYTLIINFYLMMLNARIYFPFLLKSLTCFDFVFFFLHTKIDQNEQMLHKIELTYDFVNVSLCSFVYTERMCF